MYLQSSLSKSRTPIRRKFDVPDGRGRPRVYAEAKETPFSRLAATDLLDTADIGLLYGVAPRTVYRWMAERGLKAHVKVGREYLFRKDDLLYWDENCRPTMGRPLGS
jgi:excisionase family DNA binding protein